VRDSGTRRGEAVAAFRAVAARASVSAVECLAAACGSRAGFAFGVTVGVTFVLGVELRAMVGRLPRDQKG